MSNYGIMIEEEEALKTIISTTPAPIHHRVAIERAKNHYLLNDVLASNYFPKSNQSAVDGYGVRARNIESLEFRVIGESFAGSPFMGIISEREAVRVFTGSNLPAEVNAVVMQEEVRIVDGIMVLDKSPEIGQFIRKKGEVFCEGQTIGKKGQKINPSLLGTLISDGVNQLEVSKKLRVGVITTGDEIQPIEHEGINDYQIYDSNKYMLKALLEAQGIEVDLFTSVNDDRDKLRRIISKMLEETDILLISGGISVGERDYVHGVLKGCGVVKDFWKVRVKPSKPIFYGRFNDSCQVFALPGNPVSSYIGFLIFVLPAIQYRNGALKSSLGLDETKVNLGSDIENIENRVNYILGNINEEGIFLSHKNQRSNNILALSNSNAFVRFEPRAKSIKGTEVKAILLP